MRVLEISAGTAAGYAGLLIAELGFEVDRLAVATESEFPRDTDRIAHDTFLHRQKKPVESAEPASYDVIIEDVGQRTLRKLKSTYRRARNSNPDIVFVSLSNFGMTGPYRDWKATDINAQAAGGVIHGSGFDGEAPRKLPGDAAAIIAGLHGATAAIGTTYGIQSGAATGQHIDISAQDTFMQHWTRHVADYAYSGTRMKRQMRNPAGFHVRHTERAKDGWLFMLALRQPWQDVAAFLGLGDHLTPDYMQEGAEQPPWDEIEAAYADAVRQKDRYQWFAEAAELGWTFAPIEDPWAVANGPQTRARQSMHESTVDGKTIQIPGMPFRTEHAASSDRKTSDDTYNSGADP